jgi:hypothetical protein
VLVYYPQWVRSTMSDPQYAQRRQRVLTWGSRYLIASAIAPLLALALLVIDNESSRAMLLATIATTALGLVLAYWAQHRIEDATRQMATILAPHESLAESQRP